MTSWYNIEEKKGKIVWKRMQLLANTLYRINEEFWQISFIFFQWSILHSIISYGQMSISSFLPSLYYVFIGKGINNIQVS